MRAGKEHRRTGLSTPLVVSVAVVVVAAALGVVLLQNQGQGQTRNSGELYAVSRGGFDITIPASGELVALQQIEVRNRLESRATIMEIIAEGTTVSAGDLLLRLNDEEIRNRIKDAEDAVNNAESALIASQANLAIRESAAASEYDRAELNLQLAQLALSAWRDGEDLARREQLESARETADINFRRLEARLENSIRLHEDQFISFDELERDRIAKIEAEARLKQAQRDLDVYLDYTYLQQKALKTSDVEQALAELERVKQRHEAELETARADVASKRHQLDSRRERLADLQTQMEYTVVRAPSDGLVVYASSMEMHRRGPGDPPQVGTDLSRNELVMVLPDTSRMVAAVKINEALSGVIRRGQRARVTSDAQPNTPMTGEVLNVGVLAESGGWRDPNRRDYTVRILLDDKNGATLRPSMRCRAEIFIDSIEDTLFVPVQAVHRVGRRAHVYVPVRGGFEARDVSIGRSSELYVQVLDGLDEGDQVLLRRPQSHELVRDEQREALARAERDERSSPAAATEEAAAPQRPAGPQGEVPQRQRPHGGERPSGGERPEGGERPSGAERLPRQRPADNLDSADSADSASDSADSAESPD